MIDDSIYEQSLILAEKIIASLDDKDLIAKYQEAKEKILAENQPIQIPDEYLDTNKSYEAYQQIVQENKRLKDQLKSLQENKRDFSNDPENEKYAQLIYDIRKSINVKQDDTPKSNSAIDELESLRLYLDATVNSLKFMKSGLSNENYRLKRELDRKIKNYNAQYEAAKQKAENEMMIFTNKDAELDQQIAERQQKLQELTNDFNLVHSENQKLLEEHNSCTEVLKKLDSEIERAEKNIEKMDMESETLFRDIKTLKSRLQAKNQELSHLQSLQKLSNPSAKAFNVDQEIQLLRNKAEELRSENAQLSFELKRMTKKKQSSIISDQSIISMDEDELAAQILQSKLH
ncbi:hypothetical protein TVAG_339210 [Trichomonas vaginalis G3]|uniref:Uncharacterized protein n=1 Tax=Trichomonas vaginalis (strain ATCC PRA-98 / G3) TaxID=412133 RepID=A2FMT4_TRIV3|nr:hypothetical protein TVAGG3_0300360 [Trichomonas vaginalis G3]EAX93798.1 hypothetical protein TVAG_339210 [Trichomonas vaginalis G3]KAI5527845.1 hypothetical protein TVAGG3_0300360 [Trichomonas vaginalis G3]|eukprot:XP_001306728.1 hypothetical protein [Trichomonas vaginalis G3]